jgi:hypothetical protein
MPETSDGSELRVALQSSDPTTIQIARDMLVEAGIDVFVFDDESSRMLGSTVAVATRLMVPADQISEAHERLRELGFE